MRSGSPADPIVAQYRRHRTAGKKLNHKIIDAFMNDAVLDAAARALGLGKNKQLLLDSEDDLDVLMDYGLYEIPQGGQSLIARYASERGGGNRTERDLLEAMVKAQTGLFKVERVWEQRSQLNLREVVDGSRVLSLIDVGFGQSPVEGYIFFFRPIVLSKFTMTSGIAFVFPETMEQTLIKHWGQWKGSDRYARYFRLSKSKDISMMYE